MNFFPNNFHSEGSFHHMADGAPFQVFTCDKNFFIIVLFCLFQWAFSASFSLFSSFHYIWQQTHVQNKFLSMAGFELRTSGVGGNHSTNWPTTWFCLLHKKTRQLALVRSLREWKQKMLSNNFVLDKNVVRRHNYQKSNSNLKKLSFY